MLLNFHKINSADLHIAQSNYSSASKHKCVCQLETLQLHVSIAALLYSGIQQVDLLVISVSYFNIVFLISLK